MDYYIFEKHTRRIFMLPAAISLRYLAVGFFFFIIEAKWQVANRRWDAAAAAVC